MPITRTGSVTPGANVTVPTFTFTERMTAIKTAMEQRIEENGKILDATKETAWTEEQRTKFKENLDKITELREELSTLQAHEEDRAYSKKLDDDIKAAEGSTRTTGPAAATDQRTAITSTDIAAARSIGGRNEYRYAGNVDLINPIHPTAPDKRFESFGHFLLAVVAADMGVRAIDERLEERAPTGSGTIVPSEGGFLVQGEDGGMILREAFDTGILAKLARKIRLGDGMSSIRYKQMQEDSRADGYRHGGIRVYRAAEAETVTATKPIFKEFKLDLEDMMGIYYATKTMLRSASALEGFVLDAFTKELAFTLDKEIFEGTGVGQMLGIKNSGSVVTVDKEGGQPAATIWFKNILKMWARLWSPSLNNAIWYVNRNAIPQLFTMNTTDGLGGVPVFLPGGPSAYQGATVRPQAGTLLGSPVVFGEHAESVGTKGDISLIDPTEFLMIDAEAPSWESSIHVRFLYNEMTFRISYMCNGAPLWDTALTPKKGSDTVSPFVMLAARA